MHHWTERKRGDGVPINIAFVVISGKVGCGKNFSMQEQALRAICFPKEPLIRCCLADAVCRLSTAAPLKARSDKLTKVNLSKWLCHQTFIALLLSRGKLQWNSVGNSLSGLREKTGALSCNCFHHFRKVLKRDRERYYARPTRDSGGCSEFAGLSIWGFLYDFYFHILATSLVTFK